MNTRTLSVGASITGSNAFTRMETDPYSGASTVRPLWSGDSNGAGATSSR